MAQLITAKLSRFDASPWGFRLQGGKDFGTPLVIQKVNGGSPAEKAGLQAGDAVLRVNSVDLYDLRHKDAQDAIVRAGNSFELVVQRGGSTWKPTVTPVGPMPNASSKLQPVTSTSLAAKKSEPSRIGAGHNVTARPFGAGAQVNGDLTMKSIVNKQYNTPVGIYSEQNIAETLSAQAEVLAGGVLGVNFKKNERNYNAENSEVFKMVQEIDKEPREIEQEPGMPGPVVSSLRHVSAPETTHPAPPAQQDPFKVLPPGQNICADCERLIVGVFVRIKDKNLHVECFKCATCGTSLKNVGYYRLGEKLYCDVHAKLVARQNTAYSNLEPITIPPGGRSAVGNIKAALSTAVSSPPAPGSLSPQPGTLGPMPFHAPRTSPSHVTPPQKSQPSFSAPKLFTVPQISPVQRSPPGVSAGFGSGVGSVGSAGSAGSGAQKGATFAGSTAPRRGQGVLNPSVAAGARTPVCAHCNGQVRCKKWVVACRRADLDDKSPQYLYTNCRICSDHFEPLMFLNYLKNRLHSHAVPSIFNVKNPPPLVQSTRRVLKRKADLQVQMIEHNSKSLMKTFDDQSNLMTNDGKLVCEHCKGIFTGPFISALGKIWCPEHFVCVKQHCRRQLADIGFVEDHGDLYCEYCFEQFLAPTCNKCNTKVKGDCLNAIGKHFHPECFSCTYCGSLFRNNPFFLEDGLPYCETDWNELFTTKCFACGFPIEAGDRWVEALSNNYHSQCFNCTNCKKNLEGQSFYSKGGRPFCKAHAR